MATKFFPEKVLFVPASSPHPKNTEYRCGFGKEVWDEAALVRKVQMVYNNKIAGRVSPSYPVESLDEEAVKAGMTFLSLGKGNNDPNVKTVVSASKLAGNKSMDELIEEKEDFLFDFYTELAPAMTVVSVDYQEKLVVQEEEYVVFIFRVSFGYKRTN